MSFCLDTVFIKPEKDVQIKSAIILLHGYGGDGKDISMLSLNWKRYLPNTIFICPNGHEPCSINPSGTFPPIVFSTMFNDTTSSFSLIIFSNN